MSSTAEVEKAMKKNDMSSTAEVEKAKKEEEEEEEKLKKAFEVLSKGQDNADVSADFLRRAVKNYGRNQTTLEEVKEAINYFKHKKKIEEQNQINREQLLEIVKLLEEPALVQWAKAHEFLGKEEGEKIVLYGESGVGKTWMARKIAARALRKGQFDAAIWVYLNRTYQGLSLQMSIAYQLSVLAAFEESEAEEAKKKESEKDKAKQEESEEIKEIIKREKIEMMIYKALKGKKLLLILDNEGSKMKLDWSREDEKDGKKRLPLKLGGEKGSIDLGEMLTMDKLESYKVLITRRNEPPAARDVGLTVMPLTRDESKALVFQEMDGVDKSDEIEELVDFFIGKVEGLPAEILIIAKVVSYFLGKGEMGKQKLRKDQKILEEKDLRVVDVLIRGYERLPTSVLIDCYSSETPERHFLHRGGMVNFNELISYWIMEGHLGHFDRIEDAYEEGHRVLMELMHCGLLEKQEGDYVAPSGTRFHLDIHDRDEFFRKTHPGLAITFDMKLGRVALADGMIKTVSSIVHEGKKLSTLIFDGNHIGEKLPANTLSESKSELENLAIFNPTIQHFNLPILKMRKLRSLVLRGCKFMESIEHTFQWRDDQENPKVPRSMSFPLSQMSSHKPNPSPISVISEKLEKLTVLEISGPSSLKKIPENLFKNMPNLKTLNMSCLQMERLPSSFNHLTKIEFLILRGCSCLLELDSLRNLIDLQVIDISGSTSFEKFHDKSLHLNDKLQILNLSQTSIKTLPLINKNKLLKFISLRDCEVLQRIRKIDGLENLQIFDISGAAQVEEFCDPSLENLRNLVILDISRTAIRRLPSNICNPRYLYVKDCSHLKKLPPIEDLKVVEVIDLSGSFLLEEIRKEFFKDLKGLRELNLSKTRVKQLPFLSSLGSLRRLLLSECHNLEKLESLSSLKELEFLDLSGCKALKEMEDDSFGKMNHLEYLNLSEIQLAQLPSLSELTKLKKLYVRDCPNLTELKGIEGLPELEILDHSGTILKPKPSFSNSGRPRVIGASIDNIAPQELLIELGASIELTDHQQHDQPYVDFTREDLRQCKWSIYNWRGESTIAKETLGLYGNHFLQLLKMYPSLLTKNLSRFHFLVYPTEKEAKLPDKSSYGVELSLRDIYFEQVSQEKLERCLEIREFDNVPPFLGHLLKQAQFIVLIDDPFFKSLFDLGVDNIMGMKACWIERCDELEHVIVSEKEDTNKPEESAKGKGEPGESAKSKGEPGGSAQSKGEPGESAKSKGEPGELAKSKGERGQLAKSKDEPEESAQSKGEPGEPAKSKDEQGESAKSKGEPGESAKSKGEPGVSAKSKDEPGESAKSKGEPGDSAQSKGEPGGPAKSDGEPAESAKRKGEPAESVKSKDEQGESTKSKGESGESAKSKGEPGESAKSKGEPEESAQRKGEPEESVKRKGEPGESAKSKDEQGESAKSKDEPEESAQRKGEPGESAKSKGDTEKNFAGILENLEVLWISDGMKLRSIFNGDISFKGLKSLYLEYCPQLTVICSSSLQLENLKILYVKYCQKLENLFTDDSAQLNKLTELQLWGLEELKRIECNVPSLQTLRVGECPLLEHIINASTQGHDEQHEVEGHETLKILHIKFCDKLKTICESSPEDGYFPNLQELELSGLPELQRIACTAPLLQCLRVGECPSLQHIVCSSNVLKILEVKYCEKLKKIFEGGRLDLRNVEMMELLSLPEVDNINGANSPPCLRGNCKIWGCPKLRDPQLGQARGEESQVHKSNDARNP